MNFHIVNIIFRKEMLDMVRDRRTLIATIGVPLILYPALFLFSTQALIVQQTSIEKSASKVVVFPPTVQRLRQWLEDLENVEVTDADDPDAALEQGDVDAIVRAEPDLEQRLENGESAEITIEFDATEGGSREAVSRLREGLKGPEQELLEARLKTIEINRAYIEPVVITSQNVATAQKTTGMLLGSILPVLMVVMLGVGAFYPAIDLTAGEKERGTFETLLSTPVKKIDIVSGKFFAVFVVCIFTGALNLASIVLCFAMQVAQIAQELGELELHIEPITIALIFLIILPLAFFISSIMMSIAVFARSFREAQNFVTPFFILILFPAVLAAVPGAELTGGYYFVPIANVALLFKDLLSTGAEIEAIFAVFISTVVYAGLGLLLATWLFQREEVLLAEEKGIPLSLRRREFIPRRHPTSGFAFLILCAVLLLMFYIGSYAQAQNILIGMLITQWALILLPTLGLLWFARVNLRHALNLQRPRLLPLLIVPVMAAAWSPLIMQVSYWQQKILPMPQHMIEMFEELLAASGAWGIIGALFVFALSPAICEETLFRGALLSSLRNRLPGWACVIAVGLLFGAFHLSIYRIVPTALSGMLITYLVIRGGSIAYACLFHFINNAIGLIITQQDVQETIRPWFNTDLIEKQGVPAGVLIAAAIVLTLTLAAFQTSGRASVPASRSD